MNKHNSSISYNGDSESNLKQWKSKLYFMLVFITSGLAFNSYLIQESLGLSEYLSEGLPLLAGFTFILFNIRKSFNVNPTLVIYTLYFIYLILVTIYYIALENHNILKLIFVYQYIPFIVLMANAKNIKQNLLISSISQKSYKAICIFASISAVFGIMQFFNLTDIVPIDINRARGLSRSTLNYSSLLFLAFICANQLNKSRLKILFIAVLYLGLLASQSRGGIFAASLYYLILHMKKIGNILYLFVSIIIFFILFSFFGSDYLKGYPNLLILTDRLLNGFSMEDDIGNSLRLVSYSRILDEFNLFGLGIGTTGPAAERFQEGTGYESFTLALIAHGGLVGILTYVIIGIIQYTKNQHININILALVLGYFFMMTVQQTFETPSVNILAWIILFLNLSNYRHIKRN